MGQISTRKFAISFQELGNWTEKYEVKTVIENITQFENQYFHFQISELSKVGVDARQRKSFNLLLASFNTNCI